MKKRFVLYTSMILILVLTGCAASSNVSTTTIATDDTTSSSSDFLYLDTGSLFSDRDKEIGYDESECTKITLNKNTAECSADTVTVSGSTVTITDEGSYLLSGTLNDGMIIIEAEKTDKVRLILDNVTVTSKTSAPIYVKQADKVFITLAEGSENALTNSGEFTAIDDNNIDAVIFSKEDLTLNGSGALTIKTEYGHGIVSKDSLVFTSGTYNITSKKHAISGKDSVSIAAGTFRLTSGSDGIHSENTDDASLGFIYVADGTFEIAAGTDGLDTSYILQIDGGTFHITTGGGSANSSTHSDGTSNPEWGNWGNQSDTDTTTDTASAKGLKADGVLYITNGSFTIDSSDDSVHSNSDIRVDGGTFSIASGDDGFHADSNTTINNGDINISVSYEGIEGQSIDIANGTIKINSSDDGLNAAGGKDQSSTDGRPGMNEFSADESAYLSISGGTIDISAGGDGIDSNGSLTVSGGDITVYGTTNSGNSVVDYDGESAITGGTFISAGFSGMSQNFGNNSTQGSILVDLSSQSAGSAVTLTDESGSIITSYTPASEYSSVLISSPSIQAGKTYTLKCGTYESSIAMDSLIYSNSGGMGAPGQSMGGPSGHQAP